MFSISWDKYTYTYIMASIEQGGDEVVSEQGVTATSNGEHHEGLFARTHLH